MPNSVHARQILTPIDLPLALKPLSYLTAAIGDFHSSNRHRIFAVIGGFLWIANLCMNYAFDFYESKKKYGYTWVVIQTIHLIAYLVYTFYTTQKTIPWLKEGLEEIQKEIMYRGIVNKVVRFTKRLPWLMLFFGLACASIEYGILRIDKAVHVDMGLTMSSSVTKLMHALRFISSFHVYLAYGIFWNVPVCVMLLAGYSMKCYSERMGARLRSSDLPSFKESIQTYSERAKFVKKSSSVCVVSLTMLLLTSVIRLGLNAYLFLFKGRLYLHIWHALLPLALMVYPLCTAAWITKQYHWFIIVVVRAWVERGEESDDEEEIDQVEPAEERKAINPEVLCETGKTKMNHPDLKIFSSNISSSSSPNKKTGICSPSAINVGRRNSQPSFENLQPRSGIQPHSDKVQPHNGIHRALCSTQSTPSNKSTGGMEFSTLISAVKVINKMKRMTKRKFNFDKFLSYLESMRPVVGFSIGGIIVTWDIVSTALFLIFSIVAVLVQESIFGSRKSTIT